MPVSTQDPINVSTANGVTTVFPYHFLIPSEDALAVEVDGVLTVAGFTVSGVGNPAGGNITFAVAPANGADVVRYRDLEAKRDFDWSEGGDLLASTHDANDDYAIMLIQQLLEQSRRALKVPRVESLSFDGELPAVADRASMFPVFDALGNLTVSLGTGADSGLRGDLASATGSGLVSFKRTNAAAALTRSLQLLFGGQEISLYEFLSAAQIIDYEARTLTLDLTVPIQAGLDQCGIKGGTLRLPPGSAKTTASLKPPYGVSIKGYGGEVSIICPDNAHGIELLFDSGWGNTTLEGFGLHGVNCETKIGIYRPGTTSTANTMYGLTVRDMLVDFFNVGAKFRTVRNAHFENCWFQYVTQGITLEGQCIGFTFDHCKVHAASRCGAGLSYGLYTLSYSYAVGGVAPPEGIHWSDGQCTGFDDCVHLEDVTFITFKGIDLAALKRGIYFSTIGGEFTVTGGYIDMVTGVLNGAAIYGTDQSVVINAKITFSGVNMQGVSLVAGMCGVLLGSPTVAGNVDGVTIENCNFVGFTQRDIEIALSGSFKLDNNMCRSSATSDSIGIFGIPNNRTGIIANNKCVNDITWDDPLAVSEGRLQIGPNIVNGTTKIGHVLSGSAVYDPANLADGAGVTTTVTVPGAVLGDIVEGVSFSLDLQGIGLTYGVSAANTVAVRFQNETGGAIDLGSGTLRAVVRQTLQ